MSMHKSSTKHMSAEAEDRFEEDLEGSNTGCIDDWETDLGLKILKIESKIAGAASLSSPNLPVINMLKRKLATYNAALLFLEENPKAATLVGNQGGLDSIVSYILKQAIADAAKMETRKYSDMIIPQLPGYKLSALATSGGLVKKPAAAAAEFSE